MFTGRKHSPRAIINQRNGECQVLEVSAVTVDEQVDGRVTVFYGGKQFAEIIGATGQLTGLADFLRKRL